MVIRLLRCGAGLEPSELQPDVIGSSLDYLVGCTRGLQLSTSLNKISGLRTLPERMGDLACEGDPADSGERRVRRSRVSDWYLLCIDNCREMRLWWLAKSGVWNSASFFEASERLVFPGIHRGRLLSLGW